MDTSSAVEPIVLLTNLFEGSEEQIPQRGPTTHPNSLKTAGLNRKARKMKITAFCMGGGKTH